MANRVAVILVVGLNRSLLGPWAPNLQRFASAGAVHTLRPVLPAVTCSVQASMLTGLLPGDHGIVGNGWYHRELGEVHFWKQSNRLVHGEMVWEAARLRDPAVTCANVGWWFNMHTTADFTVTPRPIYAADGRKFPDCYTRPVQWRQELQAQLGPFPLFQFWGPGASIVSSNWLADAAILTEKKFRPTLTLVYLPHLDYALQKLGPGHADIPRHVTEIDTVVGQLLDHFRGAGVTPMIVSEYGLESVDKAVAVNRVLREENLLAVREERGGEVLDPGASSAFALADHQVAHVYTHDPFPRRHPRNDPRKVADLLRSIPGVEQVHDKEAQQKLGIAHERSGDLFLVAAPGKWFSYHYWLSDDRAPDFARTVDIHRKPGYDPLELFLDPAIRFPQLTLAWKLFRRAVGLRTLMDVIPLDTALVRGSHGRVEQPPEVRPVMILEGGGVEYPDTMDCTVVRRVILDLLFRPSNQPG